MKKFVLLRTVSSLFVLLIAVAISSTAQTFTSLLSFNGADGATPKYVYLVQGLDGKFYGTTAYGGTNNYSACQFESTGCGTVFTMTAAGALTTLYNFCSVANCADGYQPWDGLIQAKSGDFYGITLYGGDSNVCNQGSNIGCGTVFRITAAGALTTLHSFNGADGFRPFGRLLQATDGNFYGTTQEGGTSTYGTVFRITPGGSLTTLRNFSNTDGNGNLPIGPLLQANDGNFYGVTLYGGNNNCSNGCGTIFQITAADAFATLHFFDGAGGNNPLAGLIQATDGNLYGTTSQETGFGNGTVFQITLAGALTTLHRFKVTDGWDPFAGLVQAKNGKFYGTTVAGGNLNSCGGDGCGTIFSLSAKTSATP